MFILIYILSMINILGALYFLPKLFEDNITNGEVCIVSIISLIPIINTGASIMLAFVYIMKIWEIVSSSNWWSKVAIHGDTPKSKRDLYNRTPEYL